jgi:hypothetical protein
MVVRKLVKNVKCHSCFQSPSQPAPSFPRHQEMLHENERWQQPKYCGVGDAGISMNKNKICNYNPQ